MSQKLENEYVHSVYSRLATYQNKEHRRSSPRVWPKVLKFVEEQSPGSIVIDVGCGEAKYTCPSVLMIGVDTCADVLIRRNRHSSPGLDLMLADALTIPIDFRDNTADAVLNVSVLHHLSTAKRRKTVVEVKCLRPGGQMLMYVWSFEQPNGTFPSQDLLVPCLQPSCKLFYFYTNIYTCTESYTSYSFFHTFLLFHFSYISYPFEHLVAVGVLILSSAKTQGEIKKNDIILVIYLLRSMPNLFS
uniref:Methyltransf_11 domain-containing protein n=1 Tax=Angiostrongylus cantonensis TaxID=6313 RepID=A0A0K0D9Q6_ANGCA